MNKYIDFRALCLGLGTVALHVCVENAKLGIHEIIWGQQQFNNGKFFYNIQREEHIALHIAFLFNVVINNDRLCT